MPVKELDASLLRARLAQAMTLREWTQADLAQATGVSTSHISLILNEKRLPSSEIIFLLCAGLEVSSDWVLGLPDRRDLKLAPDEEEVLALYRMIPDEAVRGMVLNTLRVQAQIFSTP